MKFKKIILVSIFLLAILTLTPLSASDNSTTDGENQVLGDVSSDEVIADNGSEEFPPYIYEEGGYIDDYDDNYDDEEFITQKIDLKVTYPNKIYENSATKITFTGVEDGEYMKLVADGRTYYEHFEDGKCTFSLKLAAGTKTISYKYDYMDDFAEYYDEGNFTVDVVKKPVLKANDLTKYSHETKKYKVRLLDGNGKALAGKTVKFYIWGKLIGSANTDKKGYASIKISYSEVGNKMDLKIKYDTVTFTKKITVKTVFKSFKTANVKNAKKVTLQLQTNKINGKYLKGKIVTVKVLSKKYKVKINSKGVVKLTVPQKVFKKCSTGSDTYYFADAYLGKDTAWVVILFSKVKPKLSYKLLTRFQGAGAA